MLKYDKANLRYVIGLTLVATLPALVVLMFMQIGFISCNLQDKKLKTIDFSQNWDTLRVLNNPYKGWYNHLLDNGISKYHITDDSLF